MSTTAASSHRLSMAMVLGSILLSACADRALVAPETHRAASAPLRTTSPAETNDALATLRRVTSRYHRLEAAIADGFVFLHGCEVREDGPVGIVYIHPQRVFDGTIDASLPDGLIYEPTPNGRPRLVAVEMTVPFTLWTSPQAPTFLGATFQREDEFGVFGLHVWVWKKNPKGLFAESNPRVTCTEQ